MNTAAHYSPASTIHARAAGAPHRIEPNRDAAISLIHDLVATPSISGEERAAVELLVSRMSSLGYRSFIDEVGNAVGIRGALPGTPGVRQIVLLGHIDTVPGNLTVRIEGDLLHGRGSVDAKGPLACFTMAGAAAKIPDNVSLIVIGALEEEAPTSLGARHASKIYKPDACIIGEPSGVHGITLGYKGRLLVDATFTVPPSHSAGPGPGALDAAVDWWRRVTEACSAHQPARQGPFYKLQSRLLECEARTTDEHEIARLIGGFRLPPGIESRDVEQWCREAAAPLPPIVTHTIRVDGPERAHISDRTNPVARALAASMYARGGGAGGVHATYKLKTGTSDMNVVGPVWKCPIVAYGPGDSTLDHTPHEHLSITEYLESIEILRGALELLSSELAGTPEMR